jgi:YesN/AraC family two-component response regulator
MQENPRSAGDEAPVKRSDPEISILCVEDDTISREFLCKLVSLKFPCGKIHTAHHGQAGLDVFRECLADIVVTDINMPVMDGIRMAREIRSLNPRACIIAISAYVDMGEPEEVRRIFNRCMQKPIARKQLNDALDECVAWINGGEVDG